MNERLACEEMLFGRLSLKPIRSDLGRKSQHDSERCGELVRLINERIHPPIPLTPDDVHIRTLRIVSDEINDHGGRFPEDEHERLCELLIDTPVLIGHDRSGLPVARNFDARCIADGERRWVEVSFYWLRGTYGNQLAADIDGGVVKEGSIGFEFRLPQCSLCGSDIRTCEHVPGREYSEDGEHGHLTHYEYRDIVRVLETSLVYRGATPGTHFTVPACPDAADIASQHVLRAVVLGCGPSNGTLIRYQVALRDPRDIRVCNELTIYAKNCFAIGDAVVFDNDHWSRVDRRRDPSQESGISNTQRTSSDSLLRALYGTGGRRAVTVRTAVTRSTDSVVFGSGNS